MTVYKISPWIILLAAVLPSLSCGDESDPQKIINRAISTHGGEDTRHVEIEFDFRGRHFTILQDGGRFQYEREWSDSTGRIRDVLSNEGVYREVNGKRVDLSTRLRRSVESGVNSVSYFVLLPFRLNDAAVRKRYLEATTLRGEPYHEIEVTFEKEGGGRDYDDRFVYWFHRDRHTMDYLAYGFHIDDGGTRFRKAVNVRVIGGIRFADHVNYTSALFPSPTDSVENYDDLFERGRVEHLSDIVLENVEVRQLRR
jgi:hypothetical protein